MKGITKFLQEVWSEIQKVEWPSLEEFLGSAAVTLFLIFLFALFIGGVDRALLYSVKYFFARFF